MTDPFTDPELDELFVPLSSAPQALLAVSGGVDSMALLYLASRWAAARGSKAQLAVATVNHGLRAGAADDAAFVAAAAARVGLPCQVLVWDGPKPAAAIQDAARQARYRLLVAAARAIGPDCAIVTAHTRDDQAETLLMRLARGSGTDGLAAIAPATQLLGQPVLRPLLGVPKARLVATLTGAGLTWRDDPGNEDARYERVRLRRSRPARDALGLTDAALATSAMRLRRAAQALEATACACFADLAARSELAPWGAIELPATPFAPAEIELRVIRRAIQAVAGDRAWDDPFAPDVPGLSQIEVLHRALREGHFAGQTLAGAVIEPRQRSWTANARPAGPKPVLRFVRETRRDALPRLVLEPGTTRLWDGRWMLTLAATAPAMTVEPCAAAAARDIAAKDPTWPGLALPAAVRASLPVARAQGILEAPGLSEPAGLVGFHPPATKTAIPGPEP